MSGPAGHTVVHKNMLSRNLQVSGTGKLKQAPGRKAREVLTGGHQGKRPGNPEVPSELTSDETEARAGSRTGCRQKNRLRNSS